MITFPLLLILPIHRPIELFGSNLHNKRIWQLPVSEMRVVVRFLLFQVVVNFMVKCGVNLAKFSSICSLVEELE